MKNLSAEIQDMWEKNREDFEKKLGKWLLVLEEGEELIHRARKAFHQWDPLRVYVSVAKAKFNSRVLFSLRFFGQEVAEILVKDGKVTLSLNKAHKKNNKQYFGLECEIGEYPWKGECARKFRSYFRKKALSSEGKPRVRIVEHRVESKFIQEMLKGSRKFDLPDLEIQPVTIADCPLQVPVPISASTGEPKEGNGHIDILARHRGKGRKTRLSVWELKKPKAYSHAASQAYIYAVTLLHILRHTEKGPEWYKLFGYKSPIPKPMEIEAVVAITREQKQRFDKEKTELEKNTSFNIGGDTIELYAAYYKEESQSIKLEQNPFTKSQ